VTQYTSFVAVDRLRVTIGGRARLVHIPIELPQGTRWEGFFGDRGQSPFRDDEEDRVGALGYRFGSDEIPQISLQSLLKQSESGGAAGQSPFRGDANGVYYVAPQTPTDGRLIQNLPGASRLRLAGDAAEAAKAPPRVRGLVAAKDDAQAVRAQSASAGEAVEDRGIDLGLAVTKRARRDEAVQTAPSDATAAPTKPAAPGGGAGPAAIPTAAPPPPPSPAPEPAAQPEAVKLWEAAGREFYSGQALDAHKQAATPQYDEYGNQIVEVLTIGAETLRDQVEELERQAGEKEANARGEYKAQEGAPMVAPARQVFAVAIGQRVKDGKVEEARALAQRMTGLYPDYETGKMLAALVAAEPVDGEAVEKLAAAAKVELEGLIREARLAARLDRSLIPYTTAQGLAMSLPALHEGYTPQGATMVDGGIVLTILVKEVDDQTQERFTKAGLRVEMIDKPTRLVIGVAPAGRIAEIALVDGVRQVEPMREDRAGPGGAVVPGATPGADAQP
jgi:hypothetical protein